VLGFTNVSRLAGGIISYTRELEQEKEKSSQVNDKNEIIASTNSVVDENENDALTMISKPLGARNALIKEDSLSVEVEVVGEDASSEEIGIHLSRNLLGSKFKVPKSV
jgi:predicted sulfurtransferase